MNVESAPAVRLTPEERALFAEWERRQKARGPDALELFVPHVSPKYRAPTHLAPLCRALEATLTREVEIVTSVPPRHAKTETILHAIAWLLLRRPDMRIGYVSYADEIAERKCRRARAIAIAAGVKMGAVAKQKEWETAAGGIVRSTGVLGQLTGDGFHLLIVDDAHKNREEAESPVTRSKVYEAFKSDVYSRREPAGTSVIVNGTRWHVDDLPGQLAREGWQVMNLPAMNDADEALWPEVWTAKKLRHIRGIVGPYTWSSLYQGQPVPKGARVFDAPTFSNEKWISGYRVGRGIDLAYTAKTYADRSVSIVMLAKEVRNDAGQMETKYLIADVVSQQVKADEFALVLKRHQEDWKGSPAARFYASTTERGAAELFPRIGGGIRIDARLATADKFVRAQPVAQAWNAGKIMVPPDAPWLPDFLEVVQGFTGLGDKRDDEVDALAAAYDSLATDAVELYKRMAGVGRR